MYWFLRKSARGYNALLGMSVVRTILYTIAKPMEAPVVASDPDVRWDQLTPERADRLSEVEPFAAKVARRRFHRGDLCYAAFLGLRLAHYSWVQCSGSHVITEAGTSVPVETSAFWIYDCRTAEWARGNRIYPATLNRIVCDHFQLGYSAGWIYTTRQNIASQRGIVRAGFHPVATLPAFRFGHMYYPLRRIDEGQQS
jgi:hypothetical protein